MERINQQGGAGKGVGGRVKRRDELQGNRKTRSTRNSSVARLWTYGDRAFGGRTAKRYSKVGELLLKLKALGESDAKLLKSMAGMRNILVHAYA